MQDTKQQQSASPFLLGLNGHIAALCAAAIVTQFTYRDLDEVPATCAALTPFVCTYKAKPSCSCGSQQPVTAEGAAWSQKLGRNFLPKDLPDNSFYPRSQVALFSRRTTSSIHAHQSQRAQLLHCHCRSSSACHSSQCSLCPNSRPSPLRP